MSQFTAEQLIKNNKQLCSARTNFESYWQQLHDYFYVEAQDLNKSYYPGTELSHNELYDSNSLDAADILASGFMNYLTPQTTEWFDLEPAEESFKNSRAIRTYFQDVRDEINLALNRSNYYPQKSEFFKKSGVYGTSIFFEEEDTQDAVRFYSLPAKQVCVVEDARQRVVEYYIIFEYTAEQAVTRFGFDKLPQEVQEAARGGRTDRKYQYLLYIGPRWDRDPRKTDAINMPIISQWIDVQKKTTIMEGGYREMPATCHRFFKRANIVWGFSPAMKALPDTRVLNAIAKTQLRAAMKATDPAIAVPDNAFLLPFNMNPRGVNRYDKKALNSKDDVFPIGAYGNPQIGMEMMEYRVNRIRSMMFNDVFLAFQNLTKDMTVPEVMERVTEKMTLLAPAVGRFITDDLDHNIMRTLNILQRSGRLPNPPDELRDNPEYKINYISSLAKAQRSSEIRSLQTAMSMIGQIAQAAPSILDKMDTDKAANVIWEITNAPTQILRDDTEVDAIRESRAEEQAKAQQMAMYAQGAQIAKDATQASKNAKESMPA